tara:strand:- start:1051 stop:2259 length:1209 start_codon:yes stop_codon:yes gene_type:complete
MAYVAKDDIIIQVDVEKDFIQGTPESYDITAYRDFIGNALNLNEPTSFHVSLFVNGNKVVQYSNPRTLGVSDILNVDKAGNAGLMQFEIDAAQSVYITPGDIYAELVIIYENYYPKPKTYVFPKIKIGEAINNPNINIDGGVTDVIESNGHHGIFTISEIDGSNPVSSGQMTMDSKSPNLVNSIIFRNLDVNNVRLTTLENFLIKRISEGVDGIITIKDKAITSMYVIYKIESWSRLDITTGGGDSEDSDGIQINVSIEAQSTGPGVTKESWTIGQKVTFELDAHGINSSLILDDGILTYVDKNINPNQTNGNYEQAGVTISHTPYLDSYVNIEVNGISVELGDGTRDKDSYFSRDLGITAVLIVDIASGDQLYWNGIQSGFDLVSDDVINLIYEAASADLV